MGAFSMLNEKKLKFWKVQVIDFNEFPNANKNMKNGTVVLSDSKKGLYIKAKDGIISVLEIQGENAKRMPISDFLRGNQINIGEILK